MKKYINRVRHQLYDYWTNMMHSTRRSMPLGAQYISKMIAWARGENWRGQRKNKK